MSSISWATIFKIKSIFLHIQTCILEATSEYLGQILQYKDHIIELIEVLEKKLHLQNYRRGFWKNFDEIKFLEEQRVKDEFFFPSPSFNAVVFSVILELIKTSILIDYLAVFTELTSSISATDSFLSRLSFLYHCILYSSKRVHCFFFFLVTFIIKQSVAGDKKNYRLRCFYSMHNEQHTFMKIH